MSDRSAPDPTRTPPPDPRDSTPKSPAAPDSLKVIMPAGEVGSRNPPHSRLATESGGTSGAEDTSRAAGYVADLTAVRDSPPGPPVQLDKAQLAGPDTIPAPPRAVPVGPSVGGAQPMSIDTPGRGPTMPAGPVSPLPKSQRTEAPDVPMRERGARAPATTAWALVCLLGAFVAAFFGFSEVVPSIAGAARIACFVLAGLFLLFGFGIGRGRRTGPQTPT